MRNITIRFFENRKFKLLVIDSEIFVILDRRLVPFGKWPVEVYNYFKEEMIKTSKILGKVEIDKQETEHELVKHYCLQNSERYQFVSNEQLIKLIEE